ncbi:MAG: hypothetical protein GY879_12600 [Planctomycetes bacterium]|nr:hypothetical protein [Planctomycetota bacterium]
MAVLLQGAGDINSDGFDDFLIGAPGYDIGTLINGAVYVYSGVDGSLLHLLLGHATVGHSAAGFAHSIDGAGDVDNDGYADIIVGAPGDLSVGSATVLSGATGAEIAKYLGGGGDQLQFRLLRFRRR